MVRAFWVQADVATFILELQFVIVKVRTIPHITNVGEAGTQDGWLSIPCIQYFYLEFETISGHNRLQ
jgi:hypothetical protein